MHLYREYSSNNKGYKCYCPTSKKFFHSMDVSFFENIPYFSNFVIQGESHNHESYNWEWPSLIKSNQPITQSNQNWNWPISLPLPHHGVSPQMPLEQSSTSPKSTQFEPPFQPKSTQLEPPFQRKSTQLEPPFQRKSTKPEPPFQPIPLLTQDNNIKVYTRRQTCEQPVLIQQSHESNLSPINPKISQEKAKLDLNIVVEFYSNLDKPIAQRK